MTSVLVRNLSLNYGSIEVLKKLTIDVAEGEFIVLLGPSGCGKSTLLNCIAGLLDVSAGQIFINGKNVTWEEPKDRGIGMVFQSYALYPQMTVEGNLSFGLKNARLPRAEIAKRVARAAEILQIGPLLQRKPAALSGGQRQRVAIGPALDGAAPQAKAAPLFGRPAPACSDRACAGARRRRLPVRRAALQPRRQA